MKLLSPPALRALAALLLAATLGLAASPPAAAAEKVTAWEALVPKDWDPGKLFEGRDLGLIREGDARELELMRELRSAWDNAPTRSELDGAPIRLPGYVVPLEVSGRQVREFLLVPYFGACIHSPPPPANQILHVVLAKPQALRSMDAVWVSGTLKLRRQDSALGASGYGLEAPRVEPYREGSR